MRIDNVLSTQPELGPSIPDGGYGWIVLFGVIYFQVAIPSLAVSYGIFLMFSTLQKVDHLIISFWDNSMIYAPICYLAIWTISDPMCRIIIANSRWPKLVGLSGTCLTCAGILLFWLAVINKHLPYHFFFAIGGIFTGFGTALILSQCEVLVAQYFRLKLYSINTILWIALIFGYILTPIFLCQSINQDGMTHAIIWYHLYILFGIVVCVVFKKPYYLKLTNFSSTIQFEREYSIYSTNPTELKTARSTIVGASTSYDSNEISPENVQGAWERFSDDEDEVVIHSPKELFTEIHMNNNTTYAFDTNEIVSTNEDANIFVTTATTTTTSSANRRLDFLTEFGFYKSMLLQITLKYSEFGFCIIFPSYLYFSSTDLHKEAIGYVVSYIFSASLLVIVILRLITFSEQRRNLYLIIFSIIGTTGNYLISTCASDGGKIVGGIFAITSTCGLTHIAEPILKLNIKSEPNKMYVTLNLITGFSFGLLLMINMTYISFFVLLGSLHLINGLMWSSTYLYSRYY